MEKLEKIEKNEGKSQSEVRIEKPRRKSFKHKLVTAVLGIGLLTGGCNVGEVPKEKKTEPVDPDPIEEVVEDEEKEVSEKDEPTEKTETYHPIVTGNDSYEVNLTDDVKEYIDNIHSSEREVLKYPVYETRGGQAHFDRARNFAWDLFGEMVEGTNPSVHSPGYTQWESEHGFVASGNSFLHVELEKPLEIPNIQINPKDKESVREALGKITGGLEHRIDDIKEEDGYYRVDFSRLVDGIPLYQLDYPFYLLLSEEGKLKEAVVWLKEFEKVGEASLLSGKEFSQNVNVRGYPKSNSFVVPDLKHPGLHTNVYEHHQPDQYRGDGVANLEDVELVYYYRFFHGDNILPMFRLSGEGVKNPERLLHEEPLKAEFEVLANAMSFEHVEGYPKK